MMRMVPSPAMFRHRIIADRRDDQSVLAARDLLDNGREQRSGGGYSRDDGRRAEGSACGGDAPVWATDRPQGALQLHRDFSDAAKTRSRREARHGADAG